jgi:hypothetical protein
MISCMRGSGRARQARWARTTPASEHSSVMASAAIAQPAARVTSSSGADAPRSSKGSEMGQAVKIIPIRIIGELSSA